MRLSAHQLLPYGRRLLTEAVPLEGIFALEYLLTGREEACVSEPAPRHKVVHRLRPIGFSEVASKNRTSLTITTLNLSPHPSDSSCISRCTTGSAFLIAFSRDTALIGIFGPANRVVVWFLPGVYGAESRVGMGSGLRCVSEEGKS